MIVGLAVALVFASVGLAVPVVWEGGARRRDARAGIAAIDAGHQASIMHRVAAPGLRALGAWLLRVTPAGMTQRLNRELAYAGNPPAWDAERVLAAKLALAGLGLVSGIFVGWSGGFGRSVALSLVCGFGGLLVPDALIRLRARSRERDVRVALPNTLDLLAISVEAGLGFDAALVRVVTQTSGPLAEELHRLIREMQLGKSRSQALRDLGERSRVSELRGFIIAMVQADVFGISIARVLEVQAREMRLKRRQRAEEQAQKVPVKIVFPLLFCIFPAMMVVLIGPSVINIYNSLIKP